jgi:DNA-binding NarL/FixJ family response regulator
VTVRVLLVDDQALVRAGLRLVLESDADVEVVGEAEDGAAGVEAAARLAPDVVLMDVRMPVLDGVEATRQVVALPDPPRVVVLTTFDLDEHVDDALRAGASGFLLKDARPEQLVAAVRSAAAGEMPLSPAVVRRLVEQRVGAPARPAPKDLDPLTPREREVLEHIARGASNAEIAGALWLSEATVKSHVNRLLAKTGLANRAQLVVLAYQSGLVTPGS